MLFFRLDCYSYAEADQCESLNSTFYLRKCYNASDSFAAGLTNNLTTQWIKKPPAEEYFT